MKTKSIFFALLGLLFSVSSHATVYTYDTDAYANSTGGGAPSTPIGNASLFLTAGEQFTVSTDPNQMWSGADTPGDPNGQILTSNANGTTSPYWKVNLNGAGAVEIGSLVAEINGIYTFIGAGTNTFTAWETGYLALQYADVNYGDNRGTIVSTVAVPEPTSVALLALGLLALFGFTYGRRSKG